MGYIYPTKILFDTEMSKSVEDSNARGASGGAANASGQRLENLFAGWAAVKLLAGEAAELPWSLPHRTFLRSIACQQACEVDDVILKTSSGGTVYVQSKSGLKIGREFDKAMCQLIRQYLAPGFGDAIDDRLVIFCDRASSKIADDFRSLLERIRRSPTDHSRISSGTPGVSALVRTRGEADVLKRVRSLVNEVRAKDNCSPSTEQEFQKFLERTYITVLDLTAEEHVNPSLELLGRVVQQNRRREVWDFLRIELFNLACNRGQLNIGALWSLLNDRRLPVTVRAGQRNGDYVPILSLLAELNERSQKRHAQRYGCMDDIYIVREPLENEFLTFLKADARLFVVVGHSGVGKSSWCTHIAGTNKWDLKFLIPGEELLPTDPSLTHSVIRLLREDAENKGIHLPENHELLEWFKVSNVLFILDGFDRIPAQLRNSHRTWLSETLFELQESRIKMVVTSRPETWNLAELDLQYDTWLRYVDADSQKTLQLSQFSAGEAEQASAKLGLPALSKYRHPGMMALAARSQFHINTQPMLHCDIIDRYLGQLWMEVGRLEQVQPSVIADFVGQVAQQFLHNDEGNVEFGMIRPLVMADRRLYQALCNTDVLLASAGRVRLNPDEVSEHLQGQQLNIAQALDNIHETEGRPIRQGIIRSALAQLERQDRQAALHFVNRLVQMMKDESSKADVRLIRTLCVTAVLEFRDLTDLHNLLVAIVQTWSYPNLLLGTDPLHDLFASSRLSPMQRIELLWLIRHEEDGYAWRTKHWLTPEYAPNFVITPWQKLIRNAIAEAGEPGFRFLLQHFNSNESLNCSEANMSDLAKGLFFVAGHLAPAVALDLANEPNFPRASWMLFHLLSKNHVEGLKWLQLRLTEGSLKAERAVEVLLHMPVVEKDTYLAIARTLLTQDLPRRLARNCWQALTKANDSQGALLLVECDDLEQSELISLLSTKTGLFHTVFSRLVNRAASHQIDSAVLRSSFMVSPSTVEMLTCFSVLDENLVKLGKSISGFSSLLEHLLYEVSNWDNIPPEVARVADSLITQGTLEARRDIMYFATGHAPEAALSQEGVKLRRTVISALAEHEDDKENLHLFVRNLFTRPAHADYARRYIKLIGERYPDIKPAKADRFLRDLNKRNIG